MRGISYTDTMKPRKTLDDFDSFLAKEALHLEAVVIGATALTLLGLIDRQTRDVDILVPQLPSDIALAAKRFAVQVRASGEALADDWLNNGPSSLPNSFPQAGKTCSEPSSSRCVTVEPT